MCGIVGYVGPKNVQNILIEGLERLEYRGYDSAGIALMPQGTGDDITLRRCVGRVEGLKNIVKELSGSWKQGIAHTRWATHGIPSESNAHPHRAGRVLLVHNGIIENYLELKKELVADGVHFDSETDTEVFAQFIEKKRREILKSRDFDALSRDEKKSICLQALFEASKHVEGHYAVLLMIAGLDGVLMGIQNGAPIVTATTGDSLYVGSDLQALLSHVTEMQFLSPHTLFCGEIGKIDFYSAKDMSPLHYPTSKINWSPDKIAKGGFEHFMLKEIFEQPEVVADTLSGRLPTNEHGFIWDFPEEHAKLWKNVEHVSLVACGTAYYAALTAKYFFERWTRVPIDVDLASEFRYRNPILHEKSLVGVISQSGETADTLAALRLAKSEGAKTFAVCNVSGSSIAREADFNYSTKAGPEIGVASTKAFTTQLTLLSALAQDVGRLRGKFPTWQEEAATMAHLPIMMEKILAQSAKYLDIGAKLERFRTLLIVGRGTMYPIALEGALKIKEISYRHAEGYAAGELKHGPIALIDHQTCAIVLCPRDALSSKTLSNLQEMKARQGHILGVGEEGHSEFQSQCHEYIGMPKAPGSLYPMLYVIPLQLIAYGLAKQLGCDIDKPRNLAKSVTVE